MCGILAYTKGVFDNPEELCLLQKDIAARGPNHWGSVEADGLHYEASVLALREPFTQQPVVVSNPGGTIQALLCFNGQIYDLPEGVTQDTQHFFSLCQRGIAEVLQLEGEFAFVFYSHSEQKVYFGRDRLGRRSLLYKLTDSGDLVVSSVAGSTGEFIECEGQGVYYTYSLETRTLSIHSALPNGKIHVSRQLEGGAAEPDSGTRILREAVAKRLVRPQSMRHDPIAVLFSGGIDCTIIAALLDDILPPNVTIDLLNVAFENKRTGTLWDTPDRLLALRSLKELEKRSMKSRFRLLEINVPYAETCDHIDTVKRLMYPNATVMDLSIALAFYFASKPQDSLDENSKILFSGLGADELFAGYSRHLGSANDPEKLATELELDFNRLPHRNLGRDDRVCASWGREVRYPFLDNDVVEHAKRLPLNQKTDGVTTKIYLRKVARALGLVAVCDEKKRAIQFGARSAKMDPGSGNLKGHNAL